VKEKLLMPNALLVKEKVMLPATQLSLKNIKKYSRKDPLQRKIMIRLQSLLRMPSSV